MAGNSVSQKLSTDSVAGSGPVVGESDYPGAAESGSATSGLKSPSAASPGYASKHGNDASAADASQFQYPIHDKYSPVLPAVGDL